MSVDLSNVTIGTKVRLRIGDVRSVSKLDDSNRPIYIEDYGWYFKSGIRPGSHNESLEIVEVLDEAKSCNWSYDREENGRTIWKTSCGYEFDRLQGDEQPRKHLCMEYCPYCGNEIKDMTTDC